MVELRVLIYIMCLKEMNKRTVNMSNIETHGSSSPEESGAYANNAPLLFPVPSYKHK